MTLHDEKKGNYKDVKSRNSYLEYWWRKSMGQGLQSLKLGKLKIHSLLGHGEE